MFELFKNTLCAEDVRNSKPASDIFLKTIEISGYSKIESLIFEDSDSGIKASKSAGIEYGFNANGFKLTYEVVNQILDSMKEKHPNSNLTFDAHIMLARVLWNSNPSEMPSKRKKSIVKELLEYVLKNDKNIIGYRYLIAKEFVIRNL